MNQRPSALWLAAAAMVAFAAPRLVRADAPAGSWISKDVGAPARAGSTDVDATGVWTIKGSGDDIFGSADNFQYAYQSIIGDASMTVQLLSRVGGDTQWAKTGLMIRDNDSDGSPNLNFTMTPGHGLHATARLVQNEQSVSFGEVGFINRSSSLFMRLQRVGSEVAGFYSADGQLWTQAGFSPVSLSTVGAEALFGLAVCAHWDGKTATGRFGQVSVRPGMVSAYGVLASGGDRSVQLQWHPVRQALGFNIYRGPADLSIGPLVKLNGPPISGTSYNDISAGLVNGAPVTYVIAPVFIGAAGSLVEGPRVAVVATPVAAPKGWLGTSINEGPKYGSLAIDGTTGQIAIQGAGGSVSNATDQGYFFNQVVQGDFQITVQALTKPGSGGTFPWGGLMIRDALDGSARRTLLSMDPGYGLFVQTRPTAANWADVNDPSPLLPARIKPPILLRLTRQRDTITPQYSTDGGKTFQAAGDPVTFDQGLPQVLYAGLSVSSSNRYALTPSKFAGLTIRSLQP